MRIEVTYKVIITLNEYSGSNKKIIHGEPHKRIILIENVCACNFNHTLLQDPKWLAQFNYEEIQLDKSTSTFYAVSARAICEGRTEEYKKLDWDFE